MSKLADQVPTGQTAPDTTQRPRVMTPERWVAVILLGAFGFLVVTRHAFREFIPTS